MIHIDEGVLRAYHDDELPGSERERVRHHLTTCEPCSTKAAALATRATWVEARLDVPEPRTIPSAQQARARWAARRSTEPISIVKENPMTPQPFWRRLPTSAIAGLAATLLVVLTLTISPLRTFAEDFLQLFRVEQVTVLPVDIDNVDLSQFEGIAQQAALMASVLEMEPIGEAAEARDAAEASDLLGKQVRLPADAVIDGLYVEAGVSMQGTINEPQMEALFAALEQPIDLPSSVDGQSFEVTVPQSVRADIGEDCQSHYYRSDRDCVTLIQLDSPIIEFPDELPVDQMAQLFLQLVGYSSGEASELSQQIDWTSTLVVPVPTRGVESQTVSVDGVEGTLLASDAEASEYHQGYALIWVRDGTLYGLAGSGDPAPGIDLANSLR